MNTEPYTQEEQAIMALLMKAHTLFVQLPQQNKVAVGDWDLAYRNMQRILNMRVLRRDYPGYEITIGE